MEQDENKLKEETNAPTIDTLTPQPFDQMAMPFQENSSFARQKYANMTGSQRQAIDYLVKELGPHAQVFLDGLTAEKLNTLLAISEERGQARLARARWNWMAKSIKYSFISLAASMLGAHLISYMVEGSVYDPHAVLESYIGADYMRRWFFAATAGALHNIYDSIWIQRGVKKVKEFTKKWQSKMMKKNSSVTKKAA